MILLRPIISIVAVAVAAAMIIKTLQLEREIDRAFAIAQSCPANKLTQN